MRQLILVLAICIPSFAQYVEVTHLGVPFEVTGHAASNAVSAPGDATSANLIVAVGNQQPGTLGVFDSVPSNGTWSTCGSFPAFNGTITTVWYKQAPTVSASMTLSYTASGLAPSFSAKAFKGAVASPCDLTLFGRTQSPATGAVPISAGAGTPTQTDELFLSFVIDYNGYVPISTIDSGFTIANTQFQTNFVYSGIALAWKILGHGSPGAINPIWSGGSGGGNESILSVSFKSAITAAIAPTAVAMGASTPPQTFTGTITGPCSTCASTCSLVSGLGTLVGCVYTPPGTISSTTTADVRVTSTESGSATADAIITLNPISVSVSPATVTVRKNFTQQFTATLLGTSNQAVTWTATNGSITSGGLYTAPSSGSIDTVTATSVADATKNGTAAVTLINNIPITLMDFTSQQVRTQYIPTNGSAGCQIGLTDDSGLGVTPYDVDGTKFSGFGTDITRPDNTWHIGSAVRLILGHRAYMQAIDGKIYSLSLQADAPHTLTITCGSDFGTLQFHTKTITQGNNYPELPAFCNGSGALYGSHCWPTIDYTVAGKEIGYVDAFTGALVKRVTGPGEAQARTTNDANPAPFAYAKDQSGTSCWSNITNAFAYSPTGPYATCSTVGGKLFLGWAQTVNIASSEFVASGFQTGTLTSIDDLRFRLQTFSSVNGDSVSVCITLDGQTCYSPTLTCIVSNVSATVLVGTVGADSQCAGGTWPGVISGGLSTWAGPYQGWGSMAPPRRDLLSSPQLAVSVNGTAVTLPSPNYPAGVTFDVDWAAGQPISITGSSSACANNLCTLAASPTDTTHLTIVENPGNIGAQTAQPTAGILFWKSAGTGTVSVNANFDFAYSSGQEVNGAGGYTTSSTIASDITNVTAAGAPLSATNLPISNATWSSSVATLTLTGLNAGIISGSPYGVAGVMPSGYNGVAKLTSVSTGGGNTTVTYALASNPGTYVSGGSVSATWHTGALAILSACNAMYFFDETSGSVRFLDGGFFTNVELGLNGNGGFGAGDGSCITQNPFSPVDSRSWYISFPNIQPTTPTTTTSGTFAVGTSGTIASCLDFTVPGEGIYIAGVGPLDSNSNHTDYYGNLVSCIGTTLTVLKPTFFSAPNGTIVAHNETVIYQNRYTGDFRSQKFQWPSGKLGSYPTTSRTPLTPTYPNDIGTKFFTLINSGCASCNSFLNAFNAGINAIHSYPGFGGFFSNGLASFAESPGQNSIYWANPFDVLNNTFTGMTDTFSNGRWGTVHATLPGGGQGYSPFGVFNIANGSNGLAGRWSSSVSQVWRSTDGITGSWDNNTCMPDLKNTGNCTTTLAPSGATVAAYAPPFAYACPAGTSDYWTTTQFDSDNQLWIINRGSTPPLVGPNPFAGTSTFFGQNNCVQIRIGGEPCTTNFTPAELASSSYTCPSAPGTKTWLQNIAVGDIWVDVAAGQDAEHGVIVQKTVNSTTDITIWLYRAAVGGGTVSSGTAVVPYPGLSLLTPNSTVNTLGADKFKHANGWLLNMDTPAYGGQWWLGSATPSNGFVIESYLDAFSHPDPGAFITGSAFADCGIGTIVAAGYNCRQFTNLPGDIATGKVLLTGYAPFFNGSLTTKFMPDSLLETYASGQASQATNDFRRWLSDYHDPTNGNGTDFEKVQGVWGSQTMTLAGSFQHIYDISVVGGTIDEKNAPLYFSDGRHLVQNISGPASAFPATQITEVKVGTGCWARATNDCWVGSTAGHVYINPKTPDSGQLCDGNQLMISSPCVSPTPAVWGQSIINNVFDPNPEGTGHIRLTGMFNSPYNTHHYAHLRYTQTGKWGFYDVTYPGAYRYSDVFAVKMPTISTDSIDRTGFVPIQITLPAGNSVVARFGYDPLFRCSGVVDPAGNFSGYNDSCTTVASPTTLQPYQWASEGAVSAITCSSGCTVNIPGISGRYMYFRIERYLAGVLTYQGPTNVYPVP